MIQKRIFTFRTLSEFLTYRICVTKDNLHYITGSLDAPIQTASSTDDVDIMYQTMVLVKDTGEGSGMIWTMGAPIAYGLSLSQINNILRAIENKQDRLESGENIKTINGQTLLGKGNIVISGGGGGGADGKSNTDISFVADEEEVNSTITQADGGSVTGKIPQASSANAGVMTARQYIDLETLKQEIKAKIDANHLATVNEQTLTKGGNIDTTPPKINKQDIDEIFNLL